MGYFRRRGWWRGIRSKDSVIGKGIRGIENREKFPGRKRGREVEFKGCKKRYKGGNGGKERGGMREGRGGRRGGRGGRRGGRGERSRGIG